MHQFAAAFLALVLAGVRGDEAATPQTVTVSVVEGSFDRITEGRCDAVGPTATSGDWMIRSDLTNDGRLPCTHHSVSPPFDTKHAHTQLTHAARGTHFSPSWRRRQ
mmetsp:Transcript_9970/g.32510  ORF Transcript_9970/g.32510 Transcript_9970/m.32510 type:complete len:106 (-) Transcript_9970:524-841(-)